MDLNLFMNRYKGGEKLMEENITLNITAKNNYLEVLKEHFSQCFDRYGNFDIEKFKIELQKQEVDFSKESYNLDWLGKSYARLLATDSATTLLKEGKEWNSKVENKNSQNLLIRGDNLEVLKHLSNAYRKEIKMIYIDPPYNTGTDGFVYQDNRKFTVEEFSKLAGIDKEKAKRVLDFVNSKSNSHSAWLTFMYPRLYIARQLLRDDGIIFVSIDDNEEAQLKILMDEIFGEENFVAKIIRLTGSTRNMSTDVDIRHDYLIMYAKNKKEINIKELERTNLNEFINPDSDPDGNWSTQDLTVRTGGYEYDIPSIDGSVLFRNKWRYNIDKMKQIMGGTNEQDFLEIYQKNALKVDVKGKEWFIVGKVVFKGRKNIPNLKKYLKDVSGITIHTIWNDIESQKQANKNLVDIFEGKKVFDNPKPIGLIKKAIKISTDSDSLILDFFAGSGTTGQAVWELNKEDGGNRKFILVQLPEPIDPKKNKTAYDFVKNELGVEEPTIFEITKERLIRVSKKIKEEIEEKNQDLGFKIFETTPIWEDYDFKAESFENQITFFDAAKLKEEDIQILLTTWKTYDGVPLTEDLKTIDLDGYIGYYYDTKLYLMFKGFETKHLKKLLEEIDANKEFNPATIVVFGYNFESKTMREIKENVSSYANKKSINIDVVIRY